MQYDVFNGDADGICALHQLRLADPRPGAVLVTGVKRDVNLLSRLTPTVERGDEATVLDISMDTNKGPLVGLLEAGCKVFYVDHHFAGLIPEHENLEAHIDLDSNICTSLIIDRYLGGRFRSWAVVAAFGDNLHAAAREAATELHLSELQLGALRELGELLNYNGYGEQVADLHFPPAELCKALQPYDDPFEFMAQSATLGKLRQGFLEDMNNARSREPYRQDAVGRVYCFPFEKWCKRVAGIFSNERARERPDLAHALLVDNGDHTFLVSVRAPLHRKQGADDLCRTFPTGGGRAAAAGINALPHALIDDFISRFSEVFSQ